MLHLSCRLAALLHAAVPFSNSNKQVAPLHERLLTALGMGTLVSSGKLGTFMSAEPLSNLDCRLSMMALWSVEHQFVQVCVQLDL